MSKDLIELVYDDILGKVVPVDGTIPESITPVSDILYCCTFGDDVQPGILSDKSPEEANAYMQSRAVAQDYKSFQFYRIEYN